ncbi:MAG: class I SAM-dependent methyltransferase [Verrucomicrobia bacterium]|nr:class I SAM-dependent methyltransferase [Verrucomicrobiota bacterium]
MNWPWTSSSRKLKQLCDEKQKLRDRLAIVKKQRDSARAHRDRAKEELRRMSAASADTLGPVDDAAQALGFSDLLMQLDKVTRELQVEKHLHENVKMDLANAEANPLPPHLDWPLPPPDLRFRIGGERAAWTFLKIGENIVGDLKKLAEAAGRDVGEFTSVLDFGAGCGRVLRFLPPVFVNAQIHAADVDPVGLAWVGGHLPFVTSTHVLPLFPPTTIPDASFDFIFAISVFTHLPLDVERAWFAELRRIARPGALIVLSYMPDTAAALHFTPELAIENVDGFSYYKTTPTDGLPDYYHVSYHTEDAIRRLAGEHFRILSVNTRAVNAHQDAVVCTSA